MGMAHRSSSDRAAGLRPQPSVFAEQHPLRCRIFGHRWRTFDRDWCGTDYQICQRIGFFPLKICGAVRSIPTGEHEITVSPEAFAIIQAAIANPPEPTEALKRLMRRGAEL